MKIIKYVFLTIGLALLAGAFYFYQSKQAFLDRAVKVQGTVTALIPSRSDNSTTYKPVVSYTTKEGKQIEFTSSVSSNPPSYHEGETVEIFYDPADPYDADINGFASLWLAPLILGILGSIFFLIGFSIILFGKMKEKKIDDLKFNGRSIITKFDNVNINYNYKVNGRSPYVIYSQWLNPATNEMHLFQSEDIWYNPTDFILSEEIKVLIDPSNPKKYYMDISFLPKVNS
ncbi:DUF3592 domain-containing protein [Flavobacterium sp. DG2-3]|uniref:DUF3592 domain-containing protein n=1 Tax=Flavobacterium sp. DG2-3 TaxID=3068317 RepID=UPI00273F5108|nr:DUF3592 domain-containing protein [Flavobacterium sp. DG2-3]MDP5202337.1 DUF3592 domain-containing protein [Flavobacterium sp. DG2-3]